MEKTTKECIVPVAVNVQQAIQFNNTAQSLSCVVLFESLKAKIYRRESLFTPIHVLVLWCAFLANNKHPYSCSLTSPLPWDRGKIEGR